MQTNHMVWFGLGASLRDRLIFSCRLVRVTSFEAHPRCPLGLVPNRSPLFAGERYVEEDPPS
jgi:hypothetical protein